MLATKMLFTYLQCSLVMCFSLRSQAHLLVQGSQVIERENQAGVICSHQMFGDCNGTLIKLLCCIVYSFFIGEQSEIIQNRSHTLVHLLSRLLMDIERSH